MPKIKREKMLQVLIWNLVRFPSIFDLYIKTIFEVENVMD